MFECTEQWYKDKVFPRVAGSNLLGTSAMAYHGLSLTGSYLPRVSMNYEHFDGYQAARFCWFYYVPTAEDKTYCEPYYGLWLPSPERAIVESILWNHKFDDLGEFYDCLSCYKGSPAEDMKKLEEIAGYFGVPWVTVLEKYNDC